MKPIVSNRGYIVQISFVNICKIKVNIAQKWMIFFFLYSCCSLTEPVSFRLGEVHLWLRTLSSGAPGARGNAVIGSLARFSSVKKNLSFRRVCCPTSLCPGHSRSVDSHHHPRDIHPHVRAGGLHRSTRLRLFAD